MSVRAAAVFCWALAEELAYRSVAYRYCAVLTHGIGEDEAHAGVLLAPTIIVSLLFASKFLGYKGEIVFGLGLGVMLQAELAYFGSVLPCVATHGFVLLTRCDPYNLSACVACNSECCAFSAIFTVLCGPCLNRSTLHNTTRRFQILQLASCT